MNSSTTALEIIQASNSYDKEIFTAERLRQSAHAAKRAVQASVVVLEVLPTNEAIRYGALAATLTQTTNPLVAAAVLGGTTFAVEGAAAISTADLLASKHGGKFMSWVNEKVNTVVPEGAKIPPVAEAGIAMLGGTAVTMVAKQREYTDRTVEENRRHGLFTASWMSAYFAVEGALISRGVEDYKDPKAIGAALIAIGGIIAAAKLAKRKIQMPPEKEQFHSAETQVEGQGTGILSPEALSESEKTSLAERYLGFRDKEDEAVRIGLFAEDVESAIQNPDSIFLSFSEETGEKVITPLLVPIEELKWFQREFFEKKYGSDKKFYYFAHGELPQDEASIKELGNYLKGILGNNAIIFMDQYVSNPMAEILHQQYLDSDPMFITEALTLTDDEKRGDVFAAPVIMTSASSEYSNLSIQETYKRMYGELDTRPEGQSMQFEFTDEEIEDLWQMYQGPFERLGEDHPYEAGFSKEDLIDLVRDPETLKFVNRDNGKITTLCLFAEDFEKCPWFNSAYYAEHYPEYSNPGDILINPGIVTDDTVKGKAYSFKLIDLATKVAAARGKDILLTFECTEISGRYIPRIVERAINNSGVATIEGLTNSVSTTTYKAIRAKQ